MADLAGADQAVVVVVDPYSTGRFYLYELKDRGFPIVCVRSTRSVDPIFARVYDSHREYFIDTLDLEDFEGGVPQLADRIRLAYEGLAAVIPGSDAGVTLGEQLSEALGMERTNGTERLLQRTDKASMQDRLRECGLAACEQCKSSDLDELLAWARARGEWPLVAKPSGGCGSDGIFFCRGEEDLRQAHGGIVGKVNPKGGTNDTVALQEFLSGDEYIVDTISKDGRHLCVAIWSQGKRKDLPWNPTGIITTENWLMQPIGEVQDTLVDYVFKVLDALHYRHGPCHTEVMLTARGPILIEVNCRMHGVQGPRAIELATGTNKASHSLDIFVGGGENFERLYVQGPQRYLYPVLKYSAQLVLCSPFQGQLQEAVAQAIQELGLPSVVEVMCRFGRGDAIVRSSDLQTSPGTVLMVNDSEEQLLADIRCLRAAEAAGAGAGGIYRVLDEPAPPRSVREAAEAARSPVEEEEKSGSRDSDEENDPNASNSPCRHGASAKPKGFGVSA